TVEDHVLNTLGQLRKRPIDVEPDVLRKALQHLKIELIAPVPAFDRTRRERQLRKRDHALRIEKRDCPKAIATRARTKRIVEREEPRLELGQRIVADRARKLRRKQVFTPAIHFDGNGAAIAM